MSPKASFPIFYFLQIHYWETFPLFFFLYNTDSLPDLHCYLCIFFSFPLKVRLKALLNTSLPLAMKSTLSLASLSCWNLSIYSQALCSVCFFPSHTHTQPSTDRWKFPATQFTILNFEVTSDTSQVCSDWWHHSSHSNWQKDDSGLWA